ncbi:MAG TPA: helix-turn-helix transcriptional regulator [Chitinophagaceae bacterium]
MNYNCIKAKLAIAGKKNRDLAEYLGSHENTVSQWCRNIYQPGYDTLFMIAEYLEVEAGELLTLRKNLKPIKKEVAKKSAKKETPKKK